MQKLIVIDRYSLIWIQSTKMRLIIKKMVLGVDFLFILFIILITKQLLHLYSMPLRKIWTHQQDRILKLLKEQRGEKKWSTIAKAMERDFGIFGRTGKQCRQRYHNHLDSSIISSEWTKSQEDILYEHHELVGNKWSIIAQNLPGRSDNCVKNHFYSKLRKAIRKLNKIIFQRFANQYHQIKISLLYKIIQTSEQKFKINSKINQDIINDCNNIKNQLYKYDQCSFSSKENQKKQQKIRKIIEGIYNYENRCKKNNKTLKKHKVSIETNATHADLPEPGQPNHNSIKKEEDQEMSYFRMIKRICEEIVISKNQ